MSFNLIHPPAIVAPAPVRVNSSSQRENIEFKDKLKRQMFFGKISKRGEDGRTYNFIDKNNNYVSSFLSPYNTDILDNVEPEIRKVVNVLIQKGYLTAGSCQGHPDDKVDKTFVRWVNIAFVSDEERQNFIDAVDSFDLPVYWYFNFLDFKENPKKLEKRDGITLYVNMQDKIFKDIYSQMSEKYSKQDLTDYWNIMFGRSYSEYYAVKMCICSCPGDIDWLTKIKTFVTWPFRNYYTRLLARELETLDTYKW
jgi:hypothetical protein